MSNVYEIGIKIGMQNAVSPVLAILSKELLGVNTHVSDLIKKFETLGMRTKLALGGGLGLAAGAATLSIYGKIVDKGNELVAVQRKMLQAGVANNEMLEATAKAYDMAAKFKNTNVVENLKLINDARSTFGSQHDATHHIEEFIKANSFLKAYEGGRHAGGKSLEGEIIAAMKSGEIAGKISPEDMKEHVAQLVAMKVAYGDNVKIRDYLAAQRTAKVSLRNTSDEFRYGMFPALVQENGVNAGTMLMTAFNKIVAGSGNRTQSIRQMLDAGILNEDQVQFDKQGRAVRFKDPGAIKGSMSAALNFGSWVMSTLKPQLDKQLDKEKKFDPLERAVRESQLISGMFPDRNAAAAITEVLQQFQKFAKDAALQKMAHDEYVKNGSQEGSYDYQKQAFDAQVKTMMETLGAPMVKTATETLRFINDGIASLASGLSKVNPEVLRAVGNSILVVGIALAGLGAAALIGAAFALAGTVGIVLSAVAAIGVGIVLFKDKLVQVADFFVKFGSDLWDGIVKDLGRIKDELMSVVSTVKSAFDSIVGAIKAFIDKISSLAGTIGSYGPGALGGADSSVNIPGVGLPSPGSKPPAGPSQGGSLLNKLKSGQDIRGDAGDHIPGLSKTAFAFPQRSQTVHIQNVAMLDGEVIHRSVMTRVLRDGEHPTQAPHHDSWGNYTPPDMQFMTG